jgi:hypothetical protein
MPEVATVDTFATSPGAIPAFARIRGETATAGLGSSSQVSELGAEREEMSELAVS